MNIRDIVNRDIVNLTNCEQEPIHIPGSIQPHGFLLGLKNNSLIIDYCSGNIAQYISISYSQLLGKSFCEVFGEQAQESFFDYVSQNLMLSSSLLKLTLADNEFLCTLHKTGDTYILEAEPISVDEKNASESYNQTSQFFSYMHDTHSLKELCQLVADGTRDITGYDRVMIYRFDNDYNGEVYAESKREDLEPFLGLHYPHTDIPAQARQLYMQNLLRIITDIDYTPVPVYTIDDTANKNLDLSLSILRSTSPIHVQYLHNMGVGATLTISLIHKKKLWGLIACHHYSPKNLSPELRLAAQLQGHFITSQIDIRQSNEEYEIARKTAIALDKVDLTKLLSENSFREFIKEPELLHLCNAAGVSVIFNNKIYSNGVTPTDEETEYLSKQLVKHTVNGHFHTEKLIDILPDKKELCSTTSGVIYHALDADSSNCIIWYKPETKAEVKWGGDPKKSIIKDKKGLHPRKSFELWKEIVDCRSSEWLQPELNSAAAFAHNLQRQINLLIITREEEKYRKLSELLKETNSELENINWISTHDLQEPLRKIQLISSRIISKEEEMSDSVKDAFMRMNSSAGRMQTLLIDILKYTRLKHTDQSVEKVNLNALINEIKLELAESINEKSAVINVESLPVINGVPFLLKQLFSNLIANSIKYSHPDRSPVIEISAEPQPVTHNRDNSVKYILIHVSDNGIGFKKEYAESIFNIFTRLHSIEEYKGSGVGLALCKKIMQNHNGHITAEGKPDQGSIINMYFPALEQ